VLVTNEWTKMTTNANFNRTVGQPKAANEFQFSDFPELPVSMKNRFPELREWEERVKQWNAENSRRLRDALTQLKG
jgi:hypothetical protein